MDIAYFIAFCIEQYKNEHKMSGKDAITIFERYGVIAYLSRNFEILRDKLQREIKTNPDASHDTQLILYEVNMKLVFGTL